MFPSAQGSAQGSPAPQRRVPSAPSLPAHYVRVPLNLLTAAAYDPLAVGLYALIARLFLVRQAPLRLSTADVLRYDPTLSRGAVLRAFERLLAGGWLLAEEQLGHKTAYTPSWGDVGGAPRPWRSDATALGRPRHIDALALDLRLLDLYMGRLRLHPTRPALITRYVTQPLLNLRDVGAYALTLNSIPTTTPRLEQWGLVQAGECVRLPSERTVLARVSQQILDDEQAATLTHQGWRKLGLVPPAPRDPMPERGEILTFVPPGMIDQVIGEGIGEVIASEQDMQTPFSAPQCAETEVSDTGAAIPWESLGIQRDDRTPPQPPQRVVGGGGMTPGDAARGRGQAPKTEVAQLLHTLNVRPRQVAELADAPLELVRAAIADGQARPYVRDLAGWVVALVRDARDQGWRIKPPATPPAEAHAAALRASFERLRAEGLGGDDAADRLTEAEEPPDGSEAAATEASAPFGGYADAPFAGEETPEETLTTQLQRELRVRTYPDLHPLIARLSVWQDGDTLTLGCTRTSDLPIMQARLLPLIGVVLAELGSSQSLRLVVAVQPSRPPEARCTAPPTAAVGVRRQRSP